MGKIALYQNQYASESLPIMFMKDNVRTKTPLNVEWIGEN